MKLIFTALIILIGIQNSFCAPVAKKKPASKEYNFYKVGDKYLFMFKDKGIYYKGKLVGACTNPCYLVSRDPNQDISRVEIKFNDISLFLEYSDFFDSNESKLEDQPIKGSPKSAVMKLNGEVIPSPEDAISYLPESMSFDVLNKRGKRYLKENKEFASYIEKFAKCVKKKDMECEMLREVDNMELSEAYYPFIRKAHKDIKRYITYNYNKGPALSERDFKTSCGFSKYKSKKWMFYCSEVAVFSSDLASDGE
ncbi:MAG: hypothetical protein COW00_01880 [Bdellovibrio sp. CG12_big_fil_rev_8_21_14_0_65_39_13]|nr:MAG: hypothetical protein COW00_01880 [Bdellovibrio sp. CG12_big_fil_rev_8_21_14_0_65_39_13]